MDCDLDHVASGGTVSWSNRTAGRGDGAKIRGVADRVTKCTRRDLASLL